MVDLVKVSKEVSRELAACGHEHSCIEGAALLSKTLAGLGICNTYPLTVAVRIHNPAVRRWIEKNGAPQDEASVKACNDAGGLTIAIGKGTEDMIPDGRWAGHLVIVVPNLFDDRHAMLDLTIIQAHRPEWGIHLQPICTRVDDLFVAGARNFPIEVNEAIVIYRAHPDDRSYNDHRDWMSTEGLDQAAANVLARLREN